MSKFLGIIDSAKGRTTAPDTAPAPSPALPVDTPPRRGPGRPRGKRSDPSFDQVSAYIPAELSYQVKLALLQERQGREFSELVAELLAEWLAHRPGG